MANTRLNPRTPGVYVEEIRLFPPSVAAVQTAIPAFIGHTENIIDEKTNEPRVTYDGDGNITNIDPVRITSLIEFRQQFGEPQSEPNIEVVINEIQNNGRTVRFETRAGFNGDSSPHNMYYALQAYFANGGGPCYIFTVGTYGGDPSIPINDTRLRQAVHFVEQVDEVTLFVFPEIQRVSSAANAQAIYDAAMAQCDELGDRFCIIDIHNQEDATFAAMTDFRAAAPGDNETRHYGAAYYPNLEMVFDYEYEEGDVNVILQTNGAPGSNSAMSALASDNRARAQAAIRDLPMNLPPAPIMAGIYARVDNDRGVWKAPANVNIRSAIRPVRNITDREQGGMNIDPFGLSVNAIRSFTGRGTLVWGARTLSGNDNEWRYVPVRRFFNMVEESVKKATEPFVFEPNDSNTWVRIKGMIENFLTVQWRAGALQGAAPEDAYFVSVGLNETMTALDILEGRLIIEIGMAVVRPAEFIILQFMHKLPVSG